MEFRTRYAIRNVPYNYDADDEPTDFHIFEADNMEAINPELKESLDYLNSQFPVSP